MMKNVSDEELEGFEKRELLELAQRYRRRIKDLKDELGTPGFTGTPQERERHQLMLTMSIAAAQLAADCARWASLGMDSPGDGEVDVRMRHVREIHESLVECRGETLWSRNMNPLVEPIEGREKT